MIGSHDSNPAIYIARPSRIETLPRTSEDTVIPLERPRRYSGGEAGELSPCARPLDALGASRVAGRES
jgi:hypothetical protein